MTLLQMLAVSAMSAAFLILFLAILYGCVCHLVFLTIVLFHRKPVKHVVVASPAPQGFSENPFGGNN